MELGSTQGCCHERAAQGAPTRSLKPRAALTSAQPQPSPSPAPRPHQQLGLLEQLNQVLGRHLAQALLGKRRHVGLQGQQGEGPAAGGLGVSMRRGRGERQGYNLIPKSRTVESPGRQHGGQTRPASSSVACRHACAPVASDRANGSTAGGRPCGCRLTGITKCVASSAKGGHAGAHMQRQGTHSDRGSCSCRGGINASMFSVVQHLPQWLQITL